jgi:hypothetical protein
VWIVERGDRYEQKPDKVLERIDLKPVFNRHREIQWSNKGDGKTFGLSEDVLDFAFTKFAEVLGGDD